MAFGQMEWKKLEWVWKDENLSFHENRGDIFELDTGTIDVLVRVCIKTAVVA